MVGILYLKNDLWSSCMWLPLIGRISLHLLSRFIDQFRVRLSLELQSKSLLNSECLHRHPSIVPLTTTRAIGSPWLLVENGLSASWLSKSQHWAKKPLNPMVRHSLLIFELCLRFFGPMDFLHLTRSIMLLSSVTCPLTSWHVEW